MTRLMEQAVERITHLPVEEQNAFAQFLLEVVSFDPKYGSIVSLDIDYQKLGITKESVEEFGKELGLR